MTTGALPPVPHNGPLVTEDDIAAVSASLRSGWLASGPRVAALEAAFAERHPPMRARAVSSGTAALTLALHALGLGDTRARIAVPTYGCSALLDAVRAGGCRAVVTDVDGDTLNVAPAALAGIAACEAVIAVHTHGLAADVDGLRRHARLVIEDCCQSLGGTDPRGRALGSIGDAAAFSFYATKVVAAGEGGLLLLRDPGAWERAGVYLDPGARETWTPRFNHRLPDPAAALALSQFQRLDDLVRRRAAVAQRYTAALPPHAAPPQAADGGRMFYRYTLRAGGPGQQRRWLDHLNAAGIRADPLIPAGHLLHRQLGQDPALFPAAERAVRTTVSVPLFAALTDEQVDRVVLALTRLPE